MRARLRLVRVVAGILVVGSVAGALVAPAGSTSSSWQSGRSLPRAFGDRPDDFGGPQVHFMYVVPAGGTDRQLDTNGLIDGVVSRIQQWLADQTDGLSLRVDTYQGQPDITYVQLPDTDAQVTATYPYPTFVVGQDLANAGFDDPNKVYAVLYDGHSTYACGGAKSPALPKLAAMYLLAQPTGDAAPCSDAPGFGSGLGPPQYFEIGLLHETLHTLGFVPACAAHVTAVDHVDDSPTDLMYHPDGKSPAGWDWRHAVLDFNHDDYYNPNGQTIGSCPASDNLANSPYLTRANFVHVNVTVEGNGSVDENELEWICDASDPCQHLVATGTQLQLAADSGYGWKLAGWSGVSCGTANSCTVTATSDTSITVSFVRETVRIAVKVKGRGTVKLSGARSLSAVPLGQTVRLVSKPAKGWHFNRWVGLCHGTKHTCTLAVSRGGTVTASFLENA